MIPFIVFVTFTGALLYFCLVFKIATIIDYKWGGYWGFIFWMMFSVGMIFTTISYFVSQ